MIDFVKLHYTTPCIDAFLDFHKECKMEHICNNQDGEVGTTKFKVRGFEIKILHSSNTKLYYVYIKGSLHKDYFDGKNYKRFTQELLNQEIDILCKALNLKAKDLEVLNLEIGVNIELPFSPIKFLEENLLLIGTKEFLRYERGRDGKELGYHCGELPEVKIYDKGLQYDLPYFLMRFEHRFRKTAPLKEAGINTLDDLRISSNIEKLAGKLLKGWRNILFCNSELDYKNEAYTEKERELVKEGVNIKYWRGLLSNNETRSSFGYHRKLYRELLEKHGKSEQSNLYKLIETEIKNCSFFPSQTNSELSSFTYTLNENNEQLDYSRKCLGCQKYLYKNQNSRSKFCSAKFVGEKEAHQCRNQNSNDRNNAKKKLHKLNSVGLLFPLNEILDSNFTKRLIK